VSLPTLHGKLVLEVFRRGSSAPVAVETEAGVYVTKLRGAGQGSLALIAEVIVAELATALGLPVPARAVIELAVGIPSRDRNDELRELLDRSAGENLGLLRVPHARDPRPEELAAVDREFASRVLWLDAWVMNLDRSPANPNVLVAGRNLWLIDHGAALPFQHDWAEVDEDEPRRASFALDRHVFRSFADELPRVDAELARALSRDVLREAVDAVPESFLTAAYPAEDSERVRARYHAYLWKRLKAPRSFST
jgi:hypothetical protein